MVWKNVCPIEHLLLIPCLSSVLALPGLLLVQTPAPYPKTTILTRIETDAGNDFGKPTAKVIEERADILSFLVKNLGMKVADKLGKRASAMQ